MKSAKLSTEKGVAHVLILVLIASAILFLAYGFFNNFTSGLFSRFTGASSSFASGPGVYVIDPATGNVLTVTSSTQVKLQLSAPWPVKTALVNPNSIIKEALAQESEGIVVEAEDLQLSNSTINVFSDISASERSAVLLNNNSKIGGTGFFAEFPTTLTIRARGDQCFGAPNMRVLLDGVAISNKSVSSSNWQDYTVTVNTSKGNHLVEFAYTNDRILRFRNYIYCNRNLRLDKITVTSSAPLPSPSHSHTPTPSPTPTAKPTILPTPAPTIKPTVAPTAIPTATPTTQPSPTPQPFVTSAVVAEDVNFTQNVKNVSSFASNPMTLDYTLSSQETKTIFVKYISSTGQVQVFQTVIQFLASQPTSQPSASPTTANIWGAVEPAMLGTCTAAVHDKYVIDGGDGFMYRTWHPQVDPSGCVFAHEHGDNPDSMKDTWVRQNWDGKFGYAARRMVSAAEPFGHAEGHDGYKVFVANVGDVNDEGRTNRTATLSTFHMGTGTPKRFTVQHHTNSIAYRYQTGTPYAATHLMMDTGGVSDVCDPRTPAPTKDGILLQNRCKLGSSYEIWSTTQTIKNGGTTLYKGFATPAVFDPITVFNKDNPTEVVYVWDPRVANIKSFPNDNWSNYRGCVRESYAQVGYFYNGAGQTTYYTDPMGNVVPQSDPMAIKQTISTSNVIGMLSTADNVAFKKKINYCQNANQLGLKN